MSDERDLTAELEEAHSELVLRGDGRLASRVQTALGEDPPDAESLRRIALAVRAALRD